MHRKLCLFFRSSTLKLNAWQTFALPNYDEVQFVISTTRAEFEVHILVF
jgi:hypothetical protein